MKMKINPKRARAAIAVVALASVPVTVLADYFYDAHVQYWAQIGGYYSSSSSGGYGSSSGLLIVGNNINLPYWVSDSLIAGYSLNLYDSNSIVFGRWNKNTSGTDLFVVGNGTSSVTTQNEMEILKDGTIHMGDDGSGSYAFEIDADGETIRIKPQGDIDMGIYSGS